MARYTYNDAEMDAAIETFTRSRQMFTLVRDSISQALCILRGVNSAGGDLSSAVDGTVLGNVSRALSQADSVLESLTTLLGRLNDARALLSRPSKSPGSGADPDAAAPGMDGARERESPVPGDSLREWTDLLE